MGSDRMSLIEFKIKLQLRGASETSGGSGGGGTTKRRWRLRARFGRKTRWGAAPCKPRLCTIKPCIEYYAESYSLIELWCASGTACGNKNKSSKRGASVETRMRKTTNFCRRRNRCKYCISVSTFNEVINALLIVSANYMRRKSDLVVFVKCAGRRYTCDI